MENVGLISALAIGVLVSSSAPVLMCALAAGLRRVAKENAPAERQSRFGSSKASA
jgi:hypothetical protein